MDPRGVIERRILLAGLVTSPSAKKLLRTAGFRTLEDVLQVIKTLFVF